MPQSLFEKLHLRTRYVRDLLASSADEPAARMSLLDIRESVRSCLALRDYLYAATELAYAEAAANRVEDYQQVGVLCLAGFDAALATYKAVEAGVQKMDADNWPADIRDEAERSLAELVQAIADVQELRKKFSARWPWVKSDLLAKSLTEEAAGRRRPAKAVLDELRSRPR